jgi:cytidylate kinase
VNAKCVAIDGPSGAGKSTVAKIVAEKLGYLYIDSGAMYRAIAWKALREGAALDDENTLTAIASTSELLLRDEKNGYTVFCDGQDISAAIRSPEVSAAASPVSAAAGVRKALVAAQRKMAEQNNVVMDGRDIGSKVLPQAEYKIFLTASLEERASRRRKELLAKGYDISFSQVMKDIEERDNRDLKRAHSPLVKTPDAVSVDTTNLSAKQAAEKILRLIREKQRGEI